jgi:ribonucleoside-diphosphate reductase alpha chain
MGKKPVLSQNAEAIARKRYFFDEKEDWEGLSKRVALHVAQVESKKTEYSDKFQEMIYNMDWIPGGRILRNCGRPRGSLFNCFVLPIGDSMEEIGRYYMESSILWSEGGGVGCNFSALRPKGDAIMGKGGSSSGLVSFLTASNATAVAIESGGQRRAAALACVDVAHPEVVNFINAKTVDGVLSHYNISVGISTDFIEAVERDSGWTLKFKQKDYAQVKARDIWNLMLTNMVKYAEPGILNFTNLFKNNSYYYDPVISTNPCGEAVLSPYDICDLGSLVLPNFITGSVNTNWKKLETTIKLAVRFLDNIIEVNKYILKENDIKAHNSRRIGLGVMGLAEYLFAKELRYGSEKSIAEIERLFTFIRNCAYEASVELSIEKGAFPKFDPISYSKASFVRKLPAQLRMDIKSKGIRNVTLLSIAPTGTISLVADVSNGLEPLFAKAYKREDRVSSRDYVHPLYRKLLEQNTIKPDWFVDSYDLKPTDHLEIQSIVQKYVDGAVSKTINLPKDFSSIDLDKILLEYIKDLKGVTVYVDGSKEGQVLNKMTEEEAMFVVQNSKQSDQLRDESEMTCATGMCEI